MLLGCFAYRFYFAPSSRGRHCITACHCAHDRRVWQHVCGQFVESQAMLLEGPASSHRHKNQHAKDSQNTAGLSRTRITFETARDSGRLTRGRRQETLCRPPRPATDGAGRGWMGDLGALRRPEGGQLAALLCLHYSARVRQTVAL